VELHPKSHKLVFRVELHPNQLYLIKTLGGFECDIFPITVSLITFIKYLQSITKTV